MARLVFRAGDELGRRRVWATDGAEVGTVPLGPDLGPLAAQGPTALGRVALFEADNGELWRTDGTPEGTTLVKKVSMPYPGWWCYQLDLAGSPCSPFVVVGHLALFLVKNGEQGFELWRTDGTPEGTTPVTSLESSGWVFFPIAFRDRLFFNAAAARLDGLFSSDGTPGGTRLVKNGVAPIFPVVAAGRLFFCDGLSGEVWVSDDSARGTRRLTRFAQDDEVQRVDPLASSGRAAFFEVVKAGGSDLWTSDGTVAGTRSILQGEALLEGGSVAFNGLLFFPRKIGDEVRLWQSDGTLGGTQEVKNLGPAEGITPLEIAAGRVFFGLSRGSSAELWVSDGTEPGTRPVADFAGHPSLPGGMTRLGPWVLFGAHDGRPALDAELWAIPAPVDLSVRDTRVSGGTCGATAEFRVTLSGPSEQPITVDFTTTDGSARAGQDYQTTSGTLTFAPGTVSELVRVPLVCMIGRGRARETFFLDLRNATHARIARSRATAALGAGQVRGSASGRLYDNW